MSVAAVQSGLEGRLSGLMHTGESMARHTSFRIGGPAALFLEADTLADLKMALESCDEHGVDYVVLGKGSNLLVSDDGYDGVVIVLGRDFKRHTVDSNRIESGAGVILAHVVRDAYSVGLSGLEFAVGVPGTVGGAVVMNAGSRDEWMGSVVESVTVFHPQRGLTKLLRSDVAWGYRTTDVARHGTVVECELVLEAGDRARIRRTMDARLQMRKSGQPLALPSAGSVFRNPEGDSAGRLIEKVGLKGMRVGGAQISEVHANFIVNCGGARASDVLSLVTMARDAVREQDGVELKPEIRFLGPFHTS